MSTKPGSRLFGAALASRLSRVTATGEFIAEMDGLRFVAIMAVILHHVMASYLEATARFGPTTLPDDWWKIARQSHLVALVSHANFGVNLFFVISGFILALPFARHYLFGREAPSLKWYYLRRLTRLEPPYIISLVFFLAVIWLTNPGHALFVPHFLASLVYAHGLIYGQASWINGVAWSLEVEVQFYLLVPLLVILFAPRNAAVRRGVFLTLILLFAWLSQSFIDPSPDRRLSGSLANFIQYFLAGFLLADLYLTRWRGAADKRLAWDLITLASALAIPVILVRFPSLYLTLPLLIVAFYAGVFRGRLSNALLTRRWIVIAGGMCYTTYLYHFFIIQALSPLTQWLASIQRPLGLDLAIQVLVLTPIIFVVCGALFVFLERPFMNKELTAGVARVISPARLRLGLLPLSNLWNRG